MLRTIFQVCAAVALIGCGGAASPSTSRPTPAAPPAAKPPGTAQQPGGTDPPMTLTEDECGRMSDHMVNVRVDEMRVADPDNVPTPDQQATIRETLRAEFTGSCLAEGVSRQVFECWLNATSSSALAECAGVGKAPAPAPDDRNP